MPNSLGSISVELEARLAKFESDFGRAARIAIRNMKQTERAVTNELNKIRRETRKFNNDFRRAFAGAFGFIGGRAILRGFVNLSDGIANVDSKLRLATRSSDEFARAQTAIFDISQRTFTSLDSSATLYQRLARATQDVEVSQDALLGIVETVNKSFAVSGATIRESNAAIIQFSQAMAAGALRGDEFRSVNEQAPRLIEAIASGANIARENLKDFAAQGILTRDLILSALSGEQASAIAEEFKEVPLTIERAGQLLQNTLARAIGQFNEATGFADIIADDY